MKFNIDFLLLLCSNSQVQVATNRVIYAQFSQQGLPQISCLFSTPFEEEKNKGHRKEGEFSICFSDEFFFSGFLEANLSNESPVEKLSLPHNVTNLREAQRLDHCHLFLAL